jgi:hypothetical protein
VLPCMLPTTHKSGLFVPAGDPDTCYPGQSDADNFSSCRVRLLYP